MNEALFEAIVCGALAVLFLYWAITGTGPEFAIPVRFIH